MRSARQLKALMKDRNSGGSSVHVPAFPVRGIALENEWST